MPQKGLGTAGTVGILIGLVTVVLLNLAWMGGVVFALYLVIKWLLSVT